MKAAHSGLQRFFGFARVPVFVVLVLISQTTNVEAQKLPPILDTGLTDPSAFNIESIKAIKKEYDSKVTGTSDADKEAARQLRNRLIGIGMDQVDAMFNSYLKKDRKHRQLLQLLLDFL